MACYKPVNAWQVTLTGKVVFKCPNVPCAAIVVPCGGCIGCRLDVSKEWAVRCYHEASLYDDNVYTTLTYNDDNLPVTGSLIKDDLVKFLKRLRSHYHTGIRYLACGEYGDELGRPHYHACLFNFRPEDLISHNKNANGDVLYSSKIIDEIWGNGFTTHGNVTFQSSAYVARYILKKVNGEKAANHYENAPDAISGHISKKTPEYVTQSTTGPSRGLGYDWYKKFGDTDCHNHDEVIINGRHYRPPRYYDKLLDEVDPLRLVAIKKNRIIKAEKQADDHTDDRLVTREIVQTIKASRLIRKLHSKD